MVLMQSPQSVHASRGRSSQREAEGTQDVQPFQSICTVPESISDVSKMARIGIVSSIYYAHLASVENSNGGGGAVAQRKAMSRNSLHNNEKFLTFLFVENALHLSNEAREISREADKSLRPTLDKTSYFTGGPLEGSKSAVSKRALGRSGDEKSRSSAQEVIMSGAMTLKQYQEQKLSEFRMKHAFHEDALSIQRVVQRSLEAVGVERIDEPLIPFTDASSWKLWDEELMRTMENVRERMSSVQDLGQPLSATLEHCRRLSLLEKMDETTEPVVEPKLLRMRPVSGQISRDDHWGNGGSDPGQIKRTKKPLGRSEEKLPGVITRVKRRGNGANVPGEKRGDDAEGGEGRGALTSSGLMRQGAATSLRESAQWDAEDQGLTLDESGAAPGRGRNRVKSPVVPKLKENKKEGGVASQSEATARLRVGGFGDSAAYDLSHSQAHASSAGRTAYSLPTTLAPPSRVPPSPWLSPTVLVPMGALAVGVVLYIVFIGF